MKKLPIDYLRTLGTTVGDVYFPQTKLLLPFDGTNGATTTSDLSNSNHTVTFNGNAQISTSLSKFGGSSCYFDGSGDYISTPSSSAFEFGTADFTIEFWARRTGAGSYPYIFDCRTGGANAVLITIYLDHTNNYVAYVYINSGTRITSTVGMSVDTWYHIALVRSSGTTTMYMNGSSVGSFSDSFSYIAAPFRLGAKSTGTYGFTGYVDDFRTTKGIARYTSTFTPPTTAHSTSAGDANKQILINSAADGVAIGTGGINQARIAKAWVNFNGSGTVAIRDSYNVSSITDDGTGKYKVNFSTAMSNINYSAVVDGKYTESGDAVYNTVGFLRRIATATSYIGVRGIGGNASSSFDDLTTCNVIVFGN